MTDRECYDRGEIPAAEYYASASRHLNSWRKASALVDAEVELRLVAELEAANPQSVAEAERVRALSKFPRKPTPEGNPA